MLLLPTIGGLLGLYFSRGEEPTYVAKATILVQYRGSGLGYGFGNFNQSAELASTYRRLATAKPFFDRVEQNSDLPFDSGGFRGIVSVDTVDSPPALEIRATHVDPGLAAAVAQVVAEQFIDYAIELRLAEIARVQAAAAVQGILNAPDVLAAQLNAIDILSLLEPVTPPSSPSGSGVRNNVLLGAAFGLVLAVGAALLLESLTDTVRFPDQLERRFGVHSLGVVFRWSGQDVGSNELVQKTAPTSGYAEAFRQIRANLQFAVASQPGNVYMVTSPGPSEGKSTVVANLAVSVAQSGKRVVLIDCDMRRPTLHNLFEQDGREPGLSNYLADPSTQLLDVIRPTFQEGVGLIPSGPTPPNPSELLGSTRMTAMINELGRQYDLVLVDSPPMLVVADGAVTAAQSHGVVIVVDGFSTRSSSLQATLSSVRNTNISVIGVIINKMRRSRFAYAYNYGYDYHYYSSYYRYYSDENEAAAGVNGRISRRLARRASKIFSRIRRN